MKQVAKTLVAMGMASLTAASFNATASTSLYVKVDGIRNSDGEVSVTLCAEDEIFPAGCSKTLKTAATKGTTTLRFEGLTAGKYAAALFHDENADGSLTFIQEGIAFSNNSNLEFGPPKFEPASFTVDGDTTINVNIRYFN